MARSYSLAHERVERQPAVRVRINFVARLQQQGGECFAQLVIVFNNEKSHVQIVLRLRCQ